MEFLDGVQWGAVAGAFGLGLRHGFDWDHVAAITDITSGQRDSRRALSFSTLYILGHGLVVTVLGTAAIVVGTTIPGWLDGLMGRVVGATLIALGLYVLVSLARHGRDARMRSRWMLAIAGGRRVLRWMRTRREAVTDPVVIDHEHEHAVHEAHDLVSVTTGAPAPAASTARAHIHRHFHLGSLPEDPFMQYGRGTSFLVGMLHGVGAETPTQMVLFATAAGAATAWAGTAFLLAFVVGLMVSNTAVALGSRAGMMDTARNFAVYAAVSTVVAVLSLYLGTVYLFDLGPALPPIFG